VRKVRVHWHKALILYFLCLGFLAGKIPVWEPVGVSRKDVWKISIPKDTSIQYKYGTHYFAVVEYSVLKSSSERGNFFYKLFHREKRKEVTGAIITKVWINGSEVWKGEGGVYDIVVDRGGNWLMTVWLGEGIGTEVWLNGEQVGLFPWAYPIQTPGFDQIVWKKEEEGQQCLMNVDNVIFCSKKIVAEKWTHSGIFWVEEVEREWRVHSLDGKVRRIALPEGKEITAHLDDFGKLWWIVDQNLYSEEQPNVPVLSVKEGWKPAWMWPYYWDMYQRPLPSTRRGKILKRGEIKKKFPFLWNRSQPLSRVFIPSESLVNAEYAFPCGKGVEIVPMSFAPIRSGGFLPGHLWLLGGTKAGAVAMFFDCSPEKGVRVEIPLFFSRNMLLATPIWLGREAPSFYYLRILIPDRLAGYSIEIMDIYSEQGEAYWTPKSLDEKVGVSNAVWVNGPPFWVGAWQWKQDQQEVSVSWEVSPLLSIKEIKEIGKQAIR